MFKRIIIISLMIDRGLYIQNSSNVFIEINNQVYFFIDNLLSELVKIMQSYYYNYERLYLDNIK